MANGSRKWNQASALDEIFSVGLILLFATFSCSADFSAIPSIDFNRPAEFLTRFDQTIKCGSGARARSIHLHLIGNLSEIIHKQ